MSVVRGRPPGLGRGIIGSIRRYWSSLSAWPAPKSPTNTRSAGLHILVSRKDRSSSPTATSGGGAVKVVVKCDGTIASIKIDPQAVNPADIDLLQDMILTAANNALSQAKEISNAEMGKVTSGLNIPGLV